MEKGQFRLFNDQYRHGKMTANTVMNRRVHSPNWHTSGDYRSSCRGAYPVR